MNEVEQVSPQLSDANFNKISELVGKTCGICLPPAKRELVKARLSKRLRTLGIKKYSDYLEYLRQDTTGDEFIAMLDVISTNVTSFFRESDHFEYLVREVFPKWLKPGGNPRRRLWSAGCSTGEEAYSIAMTLAESFPGLGSQDVKILATDLSTSALAQARQGRYAAESLQGVPPLLRKRYFSAHQAERGAYFQIRADLRRRVNFARLNLMDHWPLRGPFQVIFCCNVMIYFARSIRQQLVERFWELLAPGGILFIGHAESLSGIETKFVYLKPTIYQKHGNA